MLSEAPGASLWVEIYLNGLRRDHLNNHCHGIDVIAVRVELPQIRRAEWPRVYP